MAAPSRFIQVFNTNHLIDYSPNDAWTSTAASDNIFDHGNLGQPMAPSLQTVSQSGTFSFSFNGTEISLFGSYLPGDVNPRPTLHVQCTVDSTPLTPLLSQFPQNNWHLCKSESLPAGLHTFTFTIAVQPQSDSFFFDYLLFAPPPDNRISNALVRIEASDPSIKLFGNWTTENDTQSAPFTTSEGASLNMSFIGQRLTLFGIYSSSLPSVSSQAEYSIDGGSPTKFSLSGVNPGPFAAPLFNQILFQTAKLQPGLHGLTVRYLGNQFQTGLGIGYMLIDVPVPTMLLKPPNPTSTSSTSMSSSRSNGRTSTGSPNPTSTYDPNQTTSHSEFTSKGSHQFRNTLIGIIVGAVVFSTIVALTAFFLYRRRCKTRSFKRKISPHPQDIETPVSPISISESPLHRNITLRTATSDSLDGRYGDPLNRSSHSEMLQADSTENLLNHKTSLPQSQPFSTMFSSNKLQVRSLPTLLESSVFEDDESVVNMRRNSRAENVTVNNNAHSKPNPRLVRPLPKVPAGKANLGEKA